MWKVLVVEDDFFCRKLILEILKQRANCDVAVNGREAIEAYRLSKKENRPYDVILLDIAMPEITGIDVLKVVRDEEAKEGILLGEGIPVIMVTAFNKPFIEAFNIGCDDYIVKPINPEDLLQKISEKLHKL